MVISTIQALKVEEGEVATAVPTSVIKCQRQVHHAGWLLHVMSDCYLCSSCIATIKTQYKLGEHVVHQPMQPLFQGNISSTDPFLPSHRPILTHHNMGSKSGWCRSELATLSNICFRLHLDQSPCFDSAAIQVVLFHPCACVSWPFHRLAYERIFPKFGDELHRNGTKFIAKSWIDL